MSDDTRTPLEEARAAYQDLVESFRAGRAVKRVADNIEADCLKRAGEGGASVSYFPWDAMIDSHFPWDAMIEADAVGDLVAEMKSRGYRVRQVQNKFAVRLITISGWGHRSFDER